jgi:hypothetical protein
VQRKKTFPRPAPKNNHLSLPWTKLIHKPARLWVCDLGENKKKVKKMKIVGGFFPKVDDIEAHTLTQCERFGFEQAMHISS